MGGPHRLPERVGAGRIQVEHQVGGPVPGVGPHQRRVVLDGPLVGEPQQGSPIVAQGVGNLALGAFRPQLDGRHPVRRVPGQVLLHERRLATQYPDHRERPIAQVCDQPVTQRLEVLQEAALRGPGVREQRLIQVRQPHAGPLVVRVHLCILPCRTGNASTEGSFKEK